MYRAYQNVYSFCKYIRDVLDLLKSYLNIVFSVAIGINCYYKKR